MSRLGYVHACRRIPPRRLRAVFGRDRAFRRNTVTSLRKPDACERLQHRVPGVSNDNGGIQGHQRDSVQLGGASSVDRSEGSGAGAFPDPAPAVGGTGGEGCGRRVRAARTINAVLPPVTSTPPSSTPIATQSRKDILAPTSMSAATPREPSEFMRTTDQSPSRTFHVSVCVPTPEAEAAQKGCSVGGPWGTPPVTGRYVTRKGSKSMSWTFAWATLPRYLATAASGPMPMKSIFAPGLSPRIRTLPNQLSFKSQPGPSVSISSRVRVRA